MLIIGLILAYVWDTDLSRVPHNLKKICQYDIGIPICIVLFMFALFGKKSMQFHVTELSSAMTRKLFQQFYPVGVWVAALIAFYAFSPQYKKKRRN